MYRKIIKLSENLYECAEFVQMEVSSETEAQGKDFSENAKHPDRVKFQLGIRKKGDYRSRSAFTSTLSNPFLMALS